MPRKAANGNGMPDVPATPRVISPSPTPSEQLNGQDGYFGPTTRSAAKRRQTPIVTPPIRESPETESDPELRRARTRSRSPKKARAAINGLTSTTTTSSLRTRAKKTIIPEETETATETAATTTSTAAAASERLDNGALITPNGHLAPPSTTEPISLSQAWRDFSRSPSPLGLIPIHRHFKTMIHKHEVPRKVLHVSIGFLVYWLYVSGTQTSAVTPWLMGALIPTTTIDFLRHRSPTLNRYYVKFLGALMRESEYNRYNGVIFYLLGAWTVLYFFPKDVGVVSVMLLSWCDCAASTFGRAYGRYTPRIRKGKSLAGTLAAFAVGVATAGWFWGLLAPRMAGLVGDEDEGGRFMFKGVLRLPGVVCETIGREEWKETAVISGNVALGALSLWSGLVAAASEVVDLFGWDDNLTIPVLSGIGIWGFLKVLG